MKPIPYYIYRGDVYASLDDAIVDAEEIAVMNGLTEIITEMVGDNPVKDIEVNGAQAIKDMADDVLARES
jgi:hypothetical protein